MEQILISMDNIQRILEGFISDLKTKVNNKNLVTPYLDQFNKAGLLKTDGDGSMFLCNNGEYVKIDLNQISITQDIINTIYDLFKIKPIPLEWNNIPTNNKYYTYSSSSIHNNKIYRVCGTITEVYDIDTNTWSILKSYPSNLYNISVSYFNGKLYCIGGTDSYHIFSNNYIYDIKTNTWSNGANIITPKMAFTQELFNEKLYCIGGGWGGTPLNSNDIYDIKSNTWTLGKPTITPICYCNNLGICHNNKLYIFGGFNNSVIADIVQIYDIINNTWEKKIIKNKSEGYRLFIYENEIYNIGCSTDYIIKYDISNNSWIKTNILDIEKGGFNCHIYNKKVYCIDGKNKDVTPNNNISILSLGYNYDIKLPEELDNKLNIIKLDGDGNKLLSDNGLYINPSDNYNCMTEEQINSMINLLGV